MSLTPEISHFFFKEFATGKIASIFYVSAFYRFFKYLLEVIKARFRIFTAFSSDLFRGWTICIALIAFFPYWISSFVLIGNSNLTISGGLGTTLSSISLLYRFNYPFFNESSSFSKSIPVIDAGNTKNSNEIALKYYNEGDTL
jgi:hypothetical protein